MGATASVTSSIDPNKRLAKEEVYALVGGEEFGEDEWNRAPKDENGTIALQQVLDIMEQRKTKTNGNTRRGDDLEKARAVCLTGMVPDEDLDPAAPAHSNEPVDKDGDHVYRFYNREDLILDSVGALDHLSAFGSAAVDTVLESNTPPPYMETAQFFLDKMAQIICDEGDEHSSGFGTRYHPAHVNYSLIFNRLDVDQNSVVTAPEFNHVFRGLLGISQATVSNAEINDVFKAIDVDNDGQLTLSEFATFARGAGMCAHACVYACCMGGVRTMHHSLTRTRVAFALAWSPMAWSPRNCSPFHE